MKKVLSDKKIEVYQSEIYATNTTMFIGEKGLVMVDPNWLPREIDFLNQKFLEQSSRKATALLYTHSDYDHIISGGKIVSERYFGSLAMAQREDKNVEIGKILKWDTDLYIQRDYEPKYPVITDVISGDRQKAIVGDLEFEFWLAPGHVKDAMIAYESYSEVLILGDYLSDFEFPFVEDDFDNYLNTLQKIKTIVKDKKPKYAIPGHGSPMINIKTMMARIDYDILYLHFVIDDANDDIVVNHIRNYTFGQSLLKEHYDNVWRSKNQYDI